MILKRLLTISLGLFLLGLFASTAFAEKKKGASKHAAQNPLAKFDSNKNGVLDADEIAAIRKDYAENKTENLKQYDDNNNGKIDDAEVNGIKADFAVAPKENKPKKKK